jgi:hypothetical protein
MDRMIKAQDIVAVLRLKSCLPDSQKGKRDFVDLCSPGQNAKTLVITTNKSYLSPYAVSAYMSYDRRRYGIKKKEGGKHVGKTKGYY